MLQSPVFWLVVAVLVAVGIGFAVRSAFRERPGFKDIVKDPQLWADFELAQQKTEGAVNEAKGWSDQQVASAVRRFVFDVRVAQEAGAEQRICRSLGRRVNPELLRILRDPSLRTKLVTPTGEDLLPETPFHRLSDLLSEPPPQAIPLLMPYLEHETSDIRKQAAIAAGACGLKESVDAVRKALGDSDEYVRSSALIGLRRAIAGNRLAEETRTALFGDLQRLLSEGKNGDLAAPLLDEFDSRRAVAFFLSDPILTPNCESLHHVLRVLNTKDTTISRERVLALLDQLDRLGAKYPHTYALSEALPALGRHQVPDDRKRIETYLTHAEQIVVHGAADALVASHGLHGYEERIWKKIESSGYSSLSAPQRRFQAIAMLDAEVNNGGFDQYFFNSSGDEWEEALAGLEAMGSTEMLRIFREALAKFDGSSPSSNRSERMEQLAAVARKNDDAFSVLESQWYKKKEVIEVLAMPYIIKNAESFR